MNQEVFYGRSLGFQFCASVHTMLHTIVLAMAVCAETYRKCERVKPGSAKLATTLPSVFMTTRFLLKPELRAKQIVHTTRNADINFCKQFWGLTEASYLQVRLPFTKILFQLFFLIIFLPFLPHHHLLSHTDFSQSGFNWILPSVAVNDVIELPPEVIDVTGVGGRNIFVKSPNVSKPVYTRLISDFQAWSYSVSAHCFNPWFQPMVSAHGFSPWFQLIVSTHCFSQHG